MKRSIALLPGAKICFCISPSEYAKAVDDEPSSERNGHKSEKLYCDLVKAIHYTSFREMLEIEGFSSVIPDARSIDEAIDIYRKFYTTEDEALYGAVALHLCCSKN